MAWGELVARARRPIERGGLGIGKTAAELCYQRAREMMVEYTRTVVIGYHDHVVRASSHPLP